MDEFAGQTSKWYTDQDRARRVGLQNWNRSYLPSPRVIPTLEEAGIPARGPLKRWAPPASVPRPADPTTSGRSLFFGRVHKPLTYPSRWMGLDPNYGAAMRSPDPRVSRSGRVLQPMHLELYGGDPNPDPRFRFDSPFEEPLRNAQRRNMERLAGPGFQDSWSRVDPHVLWGLDEPGRYGRPRESWWDN